MDPSADRIESALPKVAAVVRGREPVGKEYLVGRYLATLGALLGEAVETARALQVMADSESDAYLKSLMLAARDRATRGESFEAEILKIADGDTSLLLSFLRTLAERGMTGPGFQFLGEVFILFDRGMHRGEFLLEVYHRALRFGIPLDHLSGLRDYYFFSEGVFGRTVLSTFENPEYRLAAPVVELLRLGEEAGALKEVLEDVVGYDVNRYKVQDLAVGFLLFGLLVKYGAPIRNAMRTLEESWGLRAADSLADAMASASGGFSPVWVEMMSRAESAGDVSRTSLKLGRLLRERVF